MDRDLKCLWCFFVSDPNCKCGRCLQVRNSQFCNAHHAEDYLNHLKLLRPERGIING